MVVAATARFQSPLFKVVDVGSHRTDLARRREVKYTLNPLQLDAVRRVLEDNGRRVVFNRAVSVVRSVYFDDPRLSACRANMAGLGRRRKLRLRWYDRVVPGNEWFLEIKWRDNRITGKHRLRMRSSEALGCVPYQAMRESLLAAVPERFAPIVEQYSEPIVVVEYQREHFVSPERRLRVTIDYGMVYYDQTGRRWINTSFGRRQPGLAVLEGKAPVGGEEDLRAFLFPFASRVCRCSKYVFGCQRLGLISEA